MNVAARTPEDAASPLEALGQRWERDSRRRLDALLARHGAALSPAERDVYAPAGTKPASGTDQPGTASRDRRRALVRRLLRAAVYRRRGKALAAGSMREVPADGVPAGPYNSRAALEQAVRRVLAAHPEWAAEFLDVYADLQSVCKRYGELAAKK